MKAAKLKRGQADSLSHRECTTVRRLRTFARLSWGERVLLARAAGVAWMVRLGLWLLPFRLLQEQVRSVRTRGRSRYAVNRLVWAVETACRYVPRATCLTRAIALQVLLRQQGYDSVVRIGIAKEHGRFESHAWLESEGSILIGGQESAERYAEMVASNL